MTCAGFALDGGDIIAIIVTLFVVFNWRLFFIPPATASLQDVDRRVRQGKKADARRSDHPG